MLHRKPIVNSNSTPAPEDESRGKINQTEKETEANQDPTSLKQNTNANESPQKNPMPTLNSSHLHVFIDQMENLRFESQQDLFEFISQRKLS